MKVIFMGTPNFAVPALQGLIDSEHQVVAVFTQQPKPQNRGMKVTESPVHQLAASYNIPTYTPSTLKTYENQNVIFNIEADIIVVAAYGFIIPVEILNAKKYGCLNIHPSLLPRFRGAAPLQRTIIEMDLDTGVCIMQMDEGLDTGDIIIQEKFSLVDDITLMELHDYCAKLGAKLLLKALNNIDHLPRIKQSVEGITYAHKLKKEEGEIKWQKNAFRIDAQIRGMNPWPGTYFNYNGNNIKVLEAKARFTTAPYFPPGTIIDEQFTVACGTNALRILKLQMPGKKPQSSAEFLRGYPQFTQGKVL